MWEEVGTLLSLQSSLFALKQFSSVGVMWINGPWQAISGYQFGKMDFDVIVTLRDSSIQSDHFPLWSAML
jgi:hypothetical protein